MKRSLPLLLSVLVVLFGLPLLPGSASADSFGAIVIEGPIPFDGLENIPGGGHTPAEVGVEEEEFFYSGSVDVYTYVEGNVHLGEKVIKTEDVAYKTRMLVRRPFVAADFNGTVVIESMNSTAGFDSTPAWLPSAEYFAREGIVYIGVTTSGTQAIPFLKNGCPGGLAPPCAPRYVSLGMSDNGQEYEMVNQLATALKTDGGPLPGDFGPVERVFMTGQSQQGGSVITHAGEFHFENIDGYFFMGASSARSISSGAPRLPEGERRVPTNLPVPVYRGSSEGDVRDGSTRQKDKDTSNFASFRLIEVPATSHNPIHKSEIFGLPLSFFCLNEVFSLADGPVFGSYVWNAMWENMRIQVDQGIKPPKAQRITIKKGVIQRDVFENAKGGVRLPEMDVPTASYFSPRNEGKRLCVRPDSPPFPDCIQTTGNPGTDFLLEFIARLACGFNGSMESFDEEMLTNLYEETDFYKDMVEDRAEELLADRFLLQEDFQKLIETADEVDFPELEE